MASVKPICGAHRNFAMWCDDQHEIGQIWGPSLGNEGLVVLDAIINPLYDRVAMRMKVRRNLLIQPIFLTALKRETDPKFLGWKASLRQSPKRRRGDQNIVARSLHRHFGGLSCWIPV